ncbi:histidinol-phosphatase [Treponema primitia]|uniref:histidinol-phosphatase n=1 Tax=Treponema primitia TaxID=88058 RepID=UPI0039808A00
MRASCLHTHTNFCDGKGDVESFCQAAYKKGLSAIGFSAHAPIAKKTGLKTDWHLADERLDEYIDAVKAARSRWAGKLPVYLGLEVDYIKGLTSPADKDFQSLGLDYIIGSVHYIFPPKGGEPFTVDAPAEEFEGDIRRHFPGNGEAAAEAYWDAVEGMISAGGFDILGHLDLIRKNNPHNEYFDTQGSRYRRRIRLIAPLAALSGAVIEINTGGLNRGKTADPYPSLELLRLLRERQAPVTITADAHEPSHLDGYYGLARATLLQAGYTETVEFEGSWKTVAISR